MMRIIILLTLMLSACGAEDDEPEVENDTVCQELNYDKTGQKAECLKADAGH